MTSEISVEGGGCEGEFRLKSILLSSKYIVEIWLWLRKVSKRAPMSISATWNRTVWDFLVSDTWKGTTENSELYYNWIYSILNSVLWLHHVYRQVQILVDLLIEKDKEKVHTCSGV